MSYSVSAMTPKGPISVHSGSVAQIRAAMSDARKAGAPTVSLAEDGKTITEADLGKLTSTLVKYA
ncbi:MAG TPA: hypothetical protein VGC10_05725 [Sphingomonas sp.]